MKNKPIRKEKGVAGLNVYLAIIVMLFTIGLLVSIFTIIGIKMEEQVVESATGTFTNQTLTLTNGSAIATYPENRGFIGITLSDVIVTNSTDDGGEVIASNSGLNYTVSGGFITGNESSAYIDQAINISASYSATDKAEASRIVNKTYQSIGESTEWFGLIILLGAMVVLILLVVIIITSIKQSGMTEGGA